MDSPARILCVEDDPSILQNLKLLFTKLGYAVSTAADGQEAKDALARQPADLVLTDLKMPRLDGIGLLEHVKEVAPETAVIVLTAHGSIREAVKAMRLGAADFVEKPYGTEDLRVRVERALENGRLRRENRQLKRMLGGATDGLVGASRAMEQVRKLILQVADRDSPVLIRGESGTGKEVVARAIHFSGPRSGAPFLAVDCGAISASLVESELFGHVRGAFTGAGAARDGLLVAAGGGTAFLDEIGELPLELQPKLLRVLQEREVRPVGSSKSVKVAARAVAATHRDLQEAVKDGTFRRDLFYRLNVIQIEIPALRERREDIPLLIEHFLKKQPRKFRLTDGAAAKLAEYPWPGNVRELQNAVERACALAAGDVLDVAELPREVAAGRPPEPAGPGKLADLERAAIEDALRRSGGNRKEAARLLGLSEATLYRRLQQYRLRP